MKNQRVKSFHKELLESCDQVGAKLVPLIFGSIALYVLYLRDVQVTINISIILAVLILLLIAILVLVSSARRLHSKAIHVLPRVMQQYKPSESYPGTIGLILEASELYAVDTAVSVYYTKEQHEALIGIGFVEAVQDKGLIQLIALPTETAYNDVWDRVCQNDTVVFNKISVKPSLPKMYVFTGTTHE